MGKFEKKNIIEQIKKHPLKLIITGLPYVGGVINEVDNLMQTDMLLKKLEDIEKTMQNHLRIQAVSFDDFVVITKNFTEQEYYVVRNTFKHLVLSAQPDTVEPLCKAMVDYSLKIDQDINQIVCEVMCELNSLDMKLLYNIKKYKESDQHRKEVDAGEIENSFHGFNTINWMIGENSEEDTLIEMYSILKLVKLQIIKYEYSDYEEVLHDERKMAMYFSSIGEKILDYLDVDR